MSGLLISEHFWWIKSSNEFWDQRSGLSISDSSYDAKVTVYEDRVRFWFLNVALHQFANLSSLSGDYVALSVAMAYIEGVQQYRDGKSSEGSSTDSFTKSAERIFPEAGPKAVNRLYKEVRCGLFHSGFTKGKTYLSHTFDHPLKLSGESLQINPKKFVDCVIADFEEYVKELRTNPAGELSKHFQTHWDNQWNMS